MVRDFDLQSQTLCKFDAYKSLDAKNEGICDVAYSPESNTLFVATWDMRHVTVRSLAPTSRKGEWKFSDIIKLKSEREPSLTFNKELKFERVILRVLRDGSLFFGEMKIKGIHQGTVNTNRRMKHIGRLQLPDVQEGFDAQLVDNKKILAIAMWDGWVYLFSVEKENSLKKLSRVPLRDARIPLFCGETLLVGVALGGGFVPAVREAESFTFVDGILKRKDNFELISRDEQHDITCWSYVEGTLVVWNEKAKEIILFNTNTT